MLFKSTFLVSLWTLAALAVPAPAPASDFVNKDYLKALDLSDPQSTRFLPCAKQAGYEKVVIRAYQQACGSGGRVDPNFLPTYKSAKAAGIPSVDAYMFACTGTQSTRECKPINQQLNELISVIGENKMEIHRIWFDVEPAAGECNAWNLGKTENFQLAKQWVAALRTTGLKWGIYANGNQWADMFPSRSSDIGSDLPLWAVQMDYSPNVASTHTFMGGWTEATGKQYNLDTTTPECAGDIDFDSFVD